MANANQEKEKKKAIKVVGRYAKNEGAHKKSQIKEREVNLNHKYAALSTTAGKCRACTPKK